MEEKQAGLFPISKRPKKLQDSDHFAKEWVVALHNLGIHFIKNLSETDNKFLKLEHNSITHNLVIYAKYVKGFIGFLLWMKDVPPHLNVVFLAGSTSL